jgi:hypothetical protein
MNAQLVLKKWVHRLELGNWEIDLQVLPPVEYEELEQIHGLAPGESQACVSPYSDRGEAMLALKIGSDRPELSIIHELLHLEQNGMNEVAEKMANAIDSKALAVSLTESYIDAHERCTHTLARSLFNMQHEYESKIAALKASLDEALKSNTPIAQATKQAVRKRKVKRPIGFHMDEEK